MRWLAGQFLVFILVLAVTWAILAVLPGRQPDWLQLTILVLVAAAATWFTYRRRRRQSAR